MSEITIRKMTPDDIDRVAELEELIFSVPWSKSSFFDAINSKDDIYLVAEMDGVICGYCGLWGVVGEGQITNVAVAPESRRKGIALLMLKELLKRAEAENIKEFILEVRESNIAAFTLYKQLGFEEVGIRKNFYSKPTENAIIMHLLILPL